MKPYRLRIALENARRQVDTTTLKAGRFVLKLEINRLQPTGGVTWSVENLDAVRSGDDIQVEGCIRWTPFSVEELINLVQSFEAYEQHLQVEALIESDPQKYEKLAKAAMKREEAEAKKAAELEAKKLAKLEAEAAALEAAELETQEAAEQAAAEEQARLDEETKQRRLEQRIRDAAARDLAAAP